ncbi:phage major capsid protein [Luteimonas sp. A478]
MPGSAEEKVQRILRDQGYSTKEVGALIRDARAAFQQEAAADNPTIRNQNMGNPSEIKALVERLNNGFDDFKDRYDQRVDALTKGMDEHATKLASIEMNGGLSAGGLAGPAAGAAASKRLRENGQFEEAALAVSRGSNPAPFAARIHLDSNINAALTNPDKGGETDSEFPSRPDYQGIRGPVQRTLTLLDALPIRKVSSDVVEFIQMGSSGDAGYQLKEGDEKQEVEFEGELKRAYVATIAGHTTASRQVLEDETALQALIDQILRHKVRGKLEFETVNGAGGSGQIHGLLSQAQAFTPDIGVTPADRIGEALVTQADAGFEPNLIVLNPRDWFRIQLTRKNTTDDEYVFGSPTVPVPPSLWNTRIVRTPSLAAGTALTLDTRFTTVLDRRQVSVLVSNSHKDNFTKNLITILCELRAGLEVIDTRAVRKFALTE